MAKARTKKKTTGDAGGNEASSMGDVVDQVTTAARGVARVAKAAVGAAKSVFDQNVEGAKEVISKTKRAAAKVKKSKVASKAKKVASKAKKVASKAKKVVASKAKKRAPARKGRKKKSAAKR